MQVLYATSFGSNLMSSSDSKITATVGRYGNVNAINLQIEKRERSAVNAALESQYRAAVGQPFYFGFKDGEPLAFTVSEANNQAARGKILNDDKIITTVVLSARVSDAQMATVREALTSKPIDAVRMSLAGDLNIEKSVSDKNGRAMQAQFACFYQSLEKRGISLAVVSPTGQSTAGATAQGTTPGNQLASIAGRYTRKTKPTDYVDLKPDGLFVMRQDDKDYAGSASLRGDVLTIEIANRAQTDTGRVAGNSIVDSNGEVWERLAATGERPAAASMTIDQVLQMVAAKLPDDVVIAAIEKSGTKFALTPADLIRLKTAGVSDAVIRAVTK
jgi:hypothetical protein